MNTNKFNKKNKKTKKSKKKFLKKTKIFRDLTFSDFFLFYTENFGTFWFFSKKYAKQKNKSKFNKKNTKEKI